MIDEKLREILTEFASKYPIDLDTVEKLIASSREDLLYGFFVSDLFPEEIYRKIAKQVVESKRDGLLMNILRFPTKYTLEAILNSSSDVKMRVVEIAYDVYKCIFDVLNEWKLDLLKNDVIRKLRGYNVDFHEVETYEELELISKETGIDVKDLEAVFLYLDDVYEAIWDDLTKCRLISTDQQMIDFFLKLSEDEELDDDHLEIINEVIQLITWIRKHGLLVSPEIEDLDLNKLLRS